MLTVLPRSRRRKEADDSGAGLLRSRRREEADDSGATEVPSLRAGGYRRVFGLLGFPLLLSLVTLAQEPGSIVVSNFNVFPEFYDPPHAAQAKSQVQGVQARPLAAGRYEVTTARLTTFNQEGARELFVQAPQCIYDSDTHSAGSAGPLEMRTADGKFQIDGKGFLWQQTNSSIFISNDVHTIVQAELLAQPVQATPAEPDKPAEPLHIYSRQFDYSSLTGLGRYRDDVKVAGTNLGLQSRFLTVEVPMKERQLQTITAEENVSIDYSGVHATGDRAVYRAATGLLDISGNPHWKTDQREGKADVLVIDATNRVLHANGQSWLKMSGQTFGSFGPQAKEPAGNQPTNHYVEIFSDNYDLATNSASFRKDVKVREWLDEQLESTMNCGELSAWYSGTNQLQRLVAEQSVVIEQQDEQMRAGKAVYTATNGLLELTDQPRWRSGLREGHGERILVAVPDNEMSVYGNAYMRVPANEAGRTVGSGAGAAPATNQYAEIFSREYVLRPQVGLFEGEVRLVHPQMNLLCDHLAMHSGAGNEKEQHLIAEHSVVFDLVSDKGQKLHGRCQKAVYDYSVTGGHTNDVLELTGRPILEATNGTVENAILILDRTQNKLMAPGRYRIKGTLGVPASTNRFRFLKK